MKDQKNADAIYVKGLTYYYQDMSERATKFFHQVLRLNPDHKPSQKIIRVSSVYFNSLVHGVLYNIMD